MVLRGFRVTYDFSFGFLVLLTGSEKLLLKKTEKGSTVDLGSL